MYRLHSAFLVNSAAHMFGDKPYNENIKPAENLWVAFGSIGEGFHNYHHTYPSDYAASEDSHPFNLTTRVIDLLAFMRMAYNLKRANRDQMRNRKTMTYAMSKDE